MEIGMLTAPLRDRSLEDVAEMAQAFGISYLEIPAGPGSPHLDPARLKARDLDRILEMVDMQDVGISSLAYYTNTSDPRQMKEIQDHAKKTIDAAARLEVPVVCMLAGMPVEGLTKIETIRKVLPKVFKPILRHAEKMNVKIALENWYATCLQGIDTFEAMFEAIPDPQFGLNYDPSHLVHQECDYFLPVSMFRDRIFHVHAKDTFIDHALRAKVGIYGSGWWRYVLPGFGCIEWGRFVSHLRNHGYDFVLSIEHEDSTQDPEEGFTRGAYYLETFC